MDIQHKTYQDQGHFFIEESGKQVAEIGYKLNGNNRLVIDHTSVDKSLEGRGIGKQLVEKVVAFARENGKKIVPECPFAATVLTRSDSYKDILVAGV